METGWKDGVAGRKDGSSSAGRPGRGAGPRTVCPTLLPAGQIAARLGTGSCVMALLVPRPARGREARAQPLPPLLGLPVTEQGPGCPTPHAPGSGPGTEPSWDG